MEKRRQLPLLKNIFEQAGKLTFCGGNIGLSPMEFLINGEKEIVLLELSSFQLETIDHFCADIAAVLNIEMTHEERYQSLTEYRKAKLKIFKNSKNSSIFYGDQKLNEAVSNINVYDIAHNISNLKKSFNFTKWVLPGEHNIKNLSLAVLIAKNLGVGDIDIQKGNRYFSRSS